MSEQLPPLSGPIFDETTQVTIVELCQICGVDHDTVIELIEEGILEPTTGQQGERTFAYTCVRRTRTVMHLQRDLGLNLAGAALALDLLDRIDELRNQLRERRN